MGFAIFMPKTVTDIYLVYFKAIVFFKKYLESRMESYQLKGIH